MSTGSGSPRSTWVYPNGVVATEEGSPDGCGGERGSEERSPGESASGQALPFDAVANLRLLGEVQRRGLDAANAVIARLTERTNAAASNGANTGPQDQMAAMADAFIESVVAVTTSMAPVGVQSSGPFPGGSRHSNAAGRASEPDSPELLSCRGTPGEAIDVALWVHNYTEDLATDVELHLTELISAGGARLSPSCVTVQPDGPFDLSAASSRQVTLTVGLTSDVTAGCYRSIVTAAHLADLWLVLVVEVEAGDSVLGDPGSVDPTCVQAEPSASNAPADSTP